MSKTFLNSIECFKCKTEMSLLNPTDAKVTRRCKCGFYEFDIEPNVVAYTEEEYEELRCELLEESAYRSCLTGIDDTISILDGDSSVESYNVGYDEPYHPIYCSECGDVVRGDMITVEETGDTETIYFGCQCGCHEGETLSEYKKRKYKLVHKEVREDA